MFNVTHDLLDNFNIPRVRKGSDVPVRFLHFSFNPSLGLVEGFMEFGEQVMSTVISQRLAELGAASVYLMTFHNNDGDHSAASALNRVRDVVKSDGFIEVVRGTCNAKLMKKADELAAAEAEERIKAAGKEFDEKTAAAIMLSVDETKDGVARIASGMATKDGVAQIASGMATKDGVAQIASGMATKDGLSRLAGIANQVKETVMIHGKGQTYTIKRLNKERDQLNTYVLKLKATIIRLHENYSMELKGKDEIIKEKDEIIKQKDEEIRKITQDARAATNRATALLVTFAKRKTPDQ